MERVLTMNDREQDVQRVWRGQPKEHVVSVDEIRVKAERFEQETRRSNIATAVLLAVLIAVEGWQIWREPALVERVGDALTIAAFVYAAYLFRGYAAVRSMPAGLGRTASVDFYREQLARRADVADHPWRYLVAFVPGVGLSLLGRAAERPAAQNVAIAAFGVALFLTVAWVNRRSASRLQEQSDELF